MVKRLAHAHPEALVAQEVRGNAGHRGQDHIGWFCGSVLIKVGVNEQENPVIVVDDLALVRSLLSEIINRQRDMEALAPPMTPWWRAR